MKTYKMAVIFLLIAAVVDVEDLRCFFPMEDITIDAVVDNLREHTKQFSTLREVAQTPDAANQDGSVSNDKEMREEADRSELSHLPKYAGTKFRKLCHEETLIPADIQRKLKCRYVDHGIPFLRIGPLREEEAYLNPRILLYHNVIYEEEIENIKILSEPMLEIAEVEDENGESEISEDRIAKSTWLQDYESRSVELLSRRVEYMTGLTIETAEPLQIAYYDIGGHYKQHFDHAEENDNSFLEETYNGNRIATVLFYMNDVLEGGGTVFTELNLTIWPRKGSALFWYNLKRNGEGDKLTEHGGCPVLLGTKWIATVWMHEQGQEFRRPCALLENE